MAKTTSDPVSGDPLVSAHFAVQVDKFAEGFFLEVSGLGSETEVTDHKIVDKQGKSIVRKIPGRRKWGDITLKRGITKNMAFYDWRKVVEDGGVDTARSNGTISMLDQAGSTIAEWEFYMGWPSKISGPSLKSDSNEIGVEEIVIVHEGIKRMK
jgi:phage tail-like protein